MGQAVGGPDGSGCVPFPSHLSCLVRDGACLL
jgi:hypothetical protein